MGGRRSWRDKGAINKKEKELERRRDNCEREKEKEREGEPVRGRSSW